MNPRWVRSLPGGAPIDFWIDVDPSRDTATLVPAGELDIATVDQFQSELDGLIEAGFGRIVVDLRRLEFIDSTVLHALLSAHKRAQHEHWRLAIVPGRPAVHRVFEVTGTIERLPFIPAPAGAGSPTPQLGGVEGGPGAPNRPPGDSLFRPYPEEGQR